MVFYNMGKREEENQNEKHIKGHCLIYGALVPWWQEHCLQTRNRNAASKI